MGSMFSAEITSGSSGSPI